MNLAIVDDNLEELQKLYKTIMDYSRTHDVAIACDRFATSAAFLSACTQISYSFVIFDIYLQDTTGIDLAAEFRRNAPRTPIVFLTSSPEHRADAFRVHAFDYLEKPVTGEMIARLFDELAITQEEETDTQAFFNLDRPEADSTALIYQLQADQYEKMQVVIPKEIAISDIDLCLIFGNLLDNVVTACRHVRADARFIRLSADLDTPGHLYITMVNSFDGNVCTRNGKYISTKERKSGIGLASIQATTQKYHGSSNFYTEQHEFISNIMLKLKENETE